MSEAASDVVPRLTVAELETALHCPRRYAFVHLDELETSDERRGGGPATRVELLSRAIAAALRSDAVAKAELLAVATDRLESLWSGHDGGYHSSAQRRHVRAVLESTLEAYLEQFGVEHASGCRQLVDAVERTERDRSVDPAPDLIGPDRPLAATVSAPLDSVGSLDSLDSPDPATDSEPSERADTSEPRNSSDSQSAPDARDGPTSQPDTIRIDATVDYVTTDGTDLVGVRFVPTASSLGPIRYRSRWDDDLLKLVEEHLEPDDEAFHPGPVAALFETAVVLEGLRGLRDRLGLPDRPCRYVQIPVADRWNSSVDWISGSVETTLEAVDLTDVYVDERDYAMAHERRNRAVDDRVAEFAATVLTGDHDPRERWPSIERHACPDCSYAVCCPEYVASEVRFDG